MADGAPVLGVIAAPALGLIWRGIVGRGAERVAFAADGTCSPPEPIHTRPRPQGELVVLVSRSHLDPRTQAFLDGLPKARTIPCGSAVKFCRVADGSADLYPRLAPTRDWDVAAGHALVEAAGGRLLAPDGTPLVYGTPDLLIPGFIASGGSYKNFRPMTRRSPGDSAFQDRRCFHFCRAAVIVLAKCETDSDRLHKARRGKSVKPGDVDELFVKSCGRRFVCCRSRGCARVRPVHRHSPACPASRRMSAGLRRRLVRRQRHSSSRRATSSRRAN